MKNKTLGASLIVTLVVYLLVVIFVPIGQSVFLDSISGIVAVLTFVFGFWAGVRLLEK